MITTVTLQDTANQSINENRTQLMWLKLQLNISPPKPRALKEQFTPPPPKKKKILPLSTHLHADGKSDEP